MCCTVRLSVSRFLNSALLSAFLRRSRMIFADLMGQRPWDILNAFAWGVRPMPPLNLRKGTHCFFSHTSSRYDCAARRDIPLMACAVSYVFLKWTLRSTHIAL